MKNIKRILLVIIFAIFLGITSSLAAQTGVISVETANLRKEANEDSSILEQLSLNEEVEVLERQGEWYQVEARGITGYLREDLITVNEEEASNETTEPTENTTQENKAVAENTTSEEQPEEQVTTTEQNVENTTQNFEIGAKKYISNDTSLKLVPLITSKNVVDVVKDTEVTISEIMNDWVCVETTNGTGWTRNNMLVDEKAEPVVEETPVEEPVQEEQPQETVQNVLYVNAGTVNLRKEPSSSAEIVTTLTLNTEVTVISEDAGWTRVKSGEYEGYIATTLLSDTKQEETVTSRSSGIREEMANTEEVASKETENATTEPPSSTGSQDGATGSAVVEKAKQYLGAKYVYGGTSPSGFDCSGFTYYIYKQFGITLNRTAAAQYSNGVSVSRDNLQLGDLIMFGKSGINHVGIYMGGGTIIHAANPSRGVTTDTINSGYYNTNYVGARRVL